jgi:hypothetical protein
VVLVYPLLLGIVLALIFGRDRSRLVGLRLRGTGLAYAALTMQVVAFPPTTHARFLPHGLSLVAWVVSDAALVVFLLVNRRVSGVPIAGAGLLLNLAAVLSNGGSMPVLPRAMHAAGFDYVAHNNSAAVVHPHLGWLIDRWAAPTWLPGANVYSVGDIAIAVAALSIPLLLTGFAMTPWSRRGLVGAPLALAVGVAAAIGGYHGFAIAAPAMLLAAPFLFARIIGRSQDVSSRMHASRRHAIRPTAGASGRAA